MYLSTGLSFALFLFIYGVVAWAKNDIDASELGLFAAIAVASIFLWPLVLAAAIGATVWDIWEARH
ncbi:hypothetical protein AB0E01_22695 [Nocardia vinacea]|uniref:hypothetical protein n=1 Tax=Nocardia vinacea TaxID=96468 RepID=UPI00340CDA7B